MAAVVLAGGVGKRMEADRYDACMINDTPRPKQFEATSTILVRRRIHDLHIYNCFHPPTHLLELQSRSGDKPTQIPSNLSPIVPKMRLQS